MLRRIPRLSMKGALLLTLFVLVIALAFPVATMLPPALVATAGPAATAGSGPKMIETPLLGPNSTTTATTLDVLGADFPLTLGNTWVYESTRYEGPNAGEAMTATSIITETVVDIQANIADFAAKIHQETSAETPIAGPADLLDLARPASTTEYWLIVAGDRLYRMDKNPDLSKLQSTDALDLVFPLKPDAKWVWLPARLPIDDSADGVYRRVLKVGTVQAPAGEFDNCFLIQEGWVTDTAEDWFCPSVGWVERRDAHNGTPFGSRQVLVQHSIPSQSPGAARETLDRFMQARVGGQEGLVLDLMTNDLKKGLERHADDVWLLEASNPCWYRYQVIQFEQTAPTRARGHVRVYQHDWAGDIAGGLPQSWEQAIGLVETSAGWRVDQMDRPANQRAEPSEPHGPTLSACAATAQSNNSPSATPTALPQVVCSSEFTTLDEGINAAPFTLLTPTYVHEEIPFYKAWIWEFDDGSQTVRLLYSPPTNDPHANLKAFDVQLTKTNKPLTLDSVTHQFREIALDVQQVQVRNTTGYAYWTPAVSMGNSAVLTWREGMMTVRIMLNGPWPEPSAENSHGLDKLLLRIAESLR